MPLAFVYSTTEGGVQSVTEDDIWCRTEGLPTVEGTKLPLDNVMASLLAALVEQQLIVDHTT